jgi:hypothetical protein
MGSFQDKARGSQELKNFEVRREKGRSSKKKAFRHFFLFTPLHSPSTPLCYHHLTLYFYFQNYHNPPLQHIHFITALTINHCFALPSSAYIFKNTPPNRSLPPQPISENIHRSIEHCFRIFPLKIYLLSSYP